MLGFVGNTGDADGTPYHLHFEIHPVALLCLGYDGAVDPTPYLDAWQRLQDIRFTHGGWLPARRSRAPRAGAGRDPAAGHRHLEASGLDPGSLRRALALAPRTARRRVASRSTPRPRRLGGERLDGSG